MIYLDNNSTTPMDPEVLEKMLPFFDQFFGNASSRTHSLGWDAAKAVDSSREAIAKLIQARTREIIFTSGATESNNLCIKGLLEMYGKQKNHIITSTAEHKSILDVCNWAKNQGFEISFLEVDSQGKVSVDQVLAKVKPSTLLVSVMMANNEIGTLNHICEIGNALKKTEVLFHTDATQALSTQEIDVDKLGIDLMSLSAHKVYGPKGVGVLYHRSQGEHKSRPAPQLLGGEQELGLRAGTPNVPGIVGFGTAALRIAAVRTTERIRLSQLRELLWARLSQKLSGIKLNGDPHNRLAGNLSISFDGIQRESLLKLLVPQIALSTGSACSSHLGEPSHVLKSIGLSDHQAKSTLRLGLGRFTTEQEVLQVSQIIVEAIEKNREISGYHS